MVVVLAGFLATMLFVALLVAGLSRTIRHKPDLSEGLICLLALGLAFGLMGRGRGPIQWFMAPPVLLSPWLNWGALGLYLAFVPLRSGLLLVRSGAVLRHLSESGLEVGPRFIPWLNASGFGTSFAEAAVFLKIGPRPRFVVADVPGPFTYGLLQPTILLPVRWIPMEVLGPRAQELKIDLGAADEQRGAPEVFVAVLHEMAHQSQGDLIRSALRGVAAFLLPFEWLQTPETNSRLETTCTNALSKTLHRAFVLTGWPLRRLAKEARDYQEERADVMALARANTSAAEEALLGRRRHHASTRPGRGYLPVMGILFLSVTLGAGAISVAPGLSLMAYSLGGEGAMSGVTLDKWRVSLVGNSYGQKPEFLYMPGSHTRKPMVVFRVLPDKGPVGGGYSKRQAALFFTMSKFPSALLGPKRFRVEWDYWVAGGPSSPPPDSRDRVLLLFRPTESYEDSQDHLVRTYFSANPSDYSVSSLGGGHYRANWTSELPVGHRASLADIEFRCFGPGLYRFNPPIISTMD